VTEKSTAVPVLMPSALAALTERVCSPRSVTASPSQSSASRESVSDQMSTAPTTMA
jgi:hypothetical protein